MIDVFLHQRTSMHGHLTEGVNTKVMFTVLLKFPIYKILKSDKSEASRFGARSGVDGVRYGE